jgi:hypothetical protein
MTAPKKDPEVEAMGKVAGALDAVDPEVAGRVIRWAAERYEVTVALAKGKKQQEQLGDDSNDETPDEFGELSDLFSAAAPSNDEDRALVVGYWLQELQEEKLPNFGSQPVNTELKNLGHGVENITRVFDNLIATTPQQVIQTKKSGTSRQGRKSYKLTRVGINRVKALIAGTADTS